MNNNNTEVKEVAVSINSSIIRMMTAVTERKEKEITIDQRNMNTRPSLQVLHKAKENLSNNIISIFVTLFYP